MVALKKLDHKAKMPANIFAYSFGAIMSLILGLGLCLLMNQALIELIVEKEFTYISVKEICEKAGVNRSTFYLHYETLGDLLQQQTARQIELINKLLAQYDAESDEEKRPGLLAKITVAGAYIKRRGNLMFIREKSDTMDISELSRCLDESFANMELMGVEEPCF